MAMSVVAIQHLMIEACEPLLQPTRNRCELFRQGCRSVGLRDFPDKAELLSIVVSPTSRRLGLGKRFLDVWLKTLRAAGLTEFVVYTDNPEGISFYNKYGGQLLFKFHLHDLYSACYRFKLPEDASLGWAAEHLAHTRQETDNVGH